MIQYSCQRGRKFGPGVIFFRSRAGWPYILEESRRPQLPVVLLVQVAGQVRLRQCRKSADLQHRLPGVSRPSAGFAAERGGWAIMVDDGTGQQSKSDGEKRHFPGRRAYVKRGMACSREPPQWHLDLHFSPLELRFSSGNICPVFVTRPLCGQILNLVEGQLHRSGLLVNLQADKR